MIRIIYQENGKQKDVTGKVIFGTVVVVAGAIGTGYLLHKFGVKKTYDKGFADGFFDATVIIHDSIVDTTETVKLKGTGRIVNLTGYLDATGESIASKLGDLVDNEALQLVFEGKNNVPKI